MTEQPTAPSDDTNWEIRFGITLAVFAAVLAINNLGSGKFGDDEIKETNEKSSAYMWYQAKGIKETQAEGQRDMMRMLLQAGAISPDKVVEIDKVADKLDSDIQRYKLEKKEILLGSAAVGEENWVQDIDGKMGQVVGAKEREQVLNRLATAGDVFDYATLCLDLCMVLGAIGLLLKIPQGRKVMLATVILLGIEGTILCARAYWIVLH